MWRRLSHYLQLVDQNQKTLAHLTGLKWSSNNLLRYIVQQRESICWIWRLTYWS